MARRGLSTKQLDRIEYYIESAFSEYLDLLRDAYDIAEARGDIKECIRIQTELLKLGEQR